MCGLNGIFAYKDSASSPSRDELLATRDHMFNRGPDDVGEWWARDRRISFGHRRLSIIDLSHRASQPMVSACGRYVIVFNGEIYNYLELRQNLQSKGYAFRSRSDTEVLLHLFAEEGEEMIHYLRGMFAIAIWDSTRRCLFLARDPYGIKPLYYADDGKTFRFASQVKALVAGGEVGTDLDSAALIALCLFGSVPEPISINRNIRALPAGHTLLVCGGSHHPRRYHSVASTYAGAEQSRQPRAVGADRLAIAREHLLQSVRAHLVADVPVGAFLSAGIDSSALVGLMRDAGQSEIQTVTLSFAEFEGSLNDEGPIAREVARTYGTNHTKRVVTKAEFEGDLPKILAAMDQPSIDGINTWFVSKAARELGWKVAISGIGGDELLGGYPSFRDIPNWTRWLSVAAAVPGLGKLVRKAGMAIGPHRLRVSAKGLSLLEYGGSFEGAWLLRRCIYMPSELPGILDPDLVRDGLSRLEPLAIVRAALDPPPQGKFAQIATMEAALYMRNQLLRDTDWASMAHSLEVRTPLVDATLLKQIAALGPPELGLPAKQELALAPCVPLPQAVTERKKTGFATPLGCWLADAVNSPAPYGYGRVWVRKLAQHQLALAAPARLAA